MFDFIEMDSSGAELQKIAIENSEFSAKYNQLFVCTLQITLQVLIFCNPLRSIYIQAAPKDKNAALPIRGGLDEVC